MSLKSILHSISCSTEWRKHTTHCLNCGGGGGEVGVNGGWEACSVYIANPLRAGFNSPSTQVEIFPRNTQINAVSFHFLFEQKNKMVFFYQMMLQL